MSTQLKKFVKKQSKKDKDIAAQILNTTQELLKKGRPDEALKFLMYNKKKHEQKPKQNLFKSLINWNK